MKKEIKAKNKTLENKLQWEKREGLSLESEDLKGNIMKPFERRWQRLLV